MRIVVFGTGGVGGYFGGRLAQAGEDVTFIARGEHLRAIQGRGLVVESSNGGFTVQPAQATDDPASLGQADVVLVAVKAWQVSEAAAAMQPLIGAGTMVVPLLNGVEAPAQLARVLGDAPIVGGFCRVLSWIEAPGVVRQHGVTPYVAFGELDNQPSARTQALLERFLKAGVNTEIPANIQAAMWQKLLFIASFSGVGAITRAPAGVMRVIPEVRGMLEGAMHEVFAVAAARGITLHPNAVAGAMKAIDDLPADATASMQRDIMEGRPSELDAQNGAIVRLGEEVGVNAPIHRFIYHALMPAEMKARGQLPE